MKKFLSPTVIVLSLFSLLLSCKEEDNTASNKRSLLGDWDPTSIELSRCPNPVEDTLQSLSCTSTSCIKYTFTIDTTNTQNYYISTLQGRIQTTERGTFTVSNDQLSLCQENEGKLECKNFNMIIQQDDLTLRRTLDDSGCYEIITLSRLIN